MAAILHKEPEPVSSLQPTTPPALDRIIRTCLAKDPDDRFQTAHDVRLQLQWIAEGGSGVGLPAPVALKRKSREKLAWAIVPAAALAAAAATLLVIRLSSEPPRTVRSSLLPPEKSSFAFDFGPMALSPDGLRVAFVATTSGTNRLWVQPLSGASAQPLDGTEGASNPFWSADSRFLGFFANRKLNKIEASGGPPQSLADAPLGRGGSWNREGVILFVPNSRAVVHRVSASGGEVSPVTKLDAAASEVSHRWPVFLPDARHFLYLAQAGGGGDENAIYAASLDGGERTRLFDGNSNVLYAPPGYLLFHRERTLLARPFAAGSLRFTGEAFPVAEDVLYFATFAQAAFAASDHGLLAYQTGVSGGETQLTWLDRTGKPIGAVGAPGRLTTPRISNDGKQVAVRILDAQSVGDIWIFDLERDTRTRFTFDPSDEFGPLWSRDDSRVLFSAARNSPGDIYQRDSAGTAKEQPLLSSNAFKMPLDWSPDGRILLLQVDDPRMPTQMDLWTYSPSGGKPIPFLQSTSNETMGRFSPDGRWIAYVSNASGKEEVYVVPFPGPGGEWQISTAGGRAPIWTRGGREIVYQAPGDEIMAVEVTTSPAFQAGIPKVLFQTHLRPPPGRQFDVTSDGERFLVNLKPGDQVSDPITLVQNWVAGRKP
jgi:Tol biopolymer transport system component